ncbi:hypothetical protein HanIR_Chr11g0535111 [Helianthus annuus]|nr:hypothetical protein HanIR_Chr11g0535111 [Helianthus annuus]
MSITYLTTVPAPYILDSKLLFSETLSTSKQEDQNASLYTTQDSVLYPHNPHNTSSLNH